MKTLALSTYVVFENEITAINEDEIKNIVSSIAEGLEDDLFIVLYTVFASPYIGFSDNIPKSGDLTQAETMAQLASEIYADGAIVFHMIVSSRCLMHECRMMDEIVSLLFSMHLRQRIEYKKFGALSDHGYLCIKHSNHDSDRVKK